MIDFNRLAVEFRKTEDKISVISWQIRINAVGSERLMQKTHKHSESGDSRPIHLKIWRKAVERILPLPNLTVTSALL